jgi:putative ABC transport system permease protein
LKKGMQPAVAGLLLGLPLSFGLSGMLRSLLFSVKPSDGATYAITGSAVLFIALIACYVPARRATRVDVVSAIRSE